MTSRIALLAGVIAVCAALYVACGGDEPETPEPKEEPKKVVEAPPKFRKSLSNTAMDETLYYPLDTCVRDGCDKPLDLLSHNADVDGRLIRTCCENCAKQVLDGKVTDALARIDAAYIETQKQRYPLLECALHECRKSLKDGAVDFLIEHHHRLIRVCCEDHKAKLLGDEKLLAATLENRIDRALIDAQRPAYERDTDKCAVNEKGLADGQKAEPNGGYQSYLLHDHLIMTCCRTCDRTIRLPNFKGFVFRANGFALKANKPLEQISVIAVKKFGYPPVESCCAGTK